MKYKINKTLLLEVLGITFKSQSELDPNVLDDMKRKGDLFRVVKNQPKHENR